MSAPNTTGRRRVISLTAEATCLSLAHHAEGDHL